MELDLQFRHFDALDSKAGIILGFSGAIVAISGARNGILAEAGLILAAIAAAAALVAFIPRQFPVIDVRVLRDKYLRAERQFTELFVLDTQIHMNIQAANLLRRKSALLKASICALLTSAVALASDVISR